MTAPLTPNEHLAGTPDQRRALRTDLAAIRATPAIHARHPGLLWVPMPALIASRPAFLDLGLLHAGTELARLRFRELGLTRLLPPERVWIGTASADPDAFGGFHYPGQGYRHLQMAAVITRYGILHDQTHPDPCLVTLDLLRAYAHDSLHYGSYRLYQWRAASHGYDIARTRYGINFRQPDGRTYSAPDRPGSPSTRNLGIIMEGATDREARSITRKAADLARIDPPAADPDRLAYRDTTGQVTTADLAAHRLSSTPGIPPRPDSHAFLMRMASYQHTVGSKYDTFLSEASPTTPDDLHTLILTAMISGSLTQLSQKLNEHYGPRAFTRMFRTPAFASPPLAA